MAELAQAAESITQDAAPVAADSAAAQDFGARDVSFNPSGDLSGGAQGSAGGSSGLDAAAGQGQGGAGAASASESEYESLIDAARGLGYDPGQHNFSDDRQFLLHLLNQQQAKTQEDYYAQLGRQLAPHYQGIQGYLQQNQPQATPATRPEWEPPEFDQQWLSLVQRDPQTGVFLAKPGVNPVIADKVNDYDKWHSKYSANPVAAMKPYVEKTMPDMVRQVFQQEMQSFRRQQQIDGIVQRNAEWMYQNQNGRPVIGVGGQPVPTTEGLRYGQLVRTLEQGGMADPVMVDQFARQLLLGEMAQGQIKGMQGQAPQAQQQAAIASGRSQANVLQSRSPQDRMSTAGATDPNQTGMSLAEMLRSSLDSAGYTDADFADPERFMS
jgi:hypothetical protein